MSANPAAIMEKLDDDFFPTKNKRAVYVRRLIQYLEKDKLKIITMKQVMLLVSLKIKLH